MTAIVYHAGKMASDTLLSVGGTKHYGPKVYRLEDGSLVGLAGDGAKCAALLAWFREGKKGKAPRWSGVTALHLTETSLCLYASSEHPIDLDRGQPAAIGSGMDAAIGAMRGGLGLEAAIRAAIESNIYCGGDVEVMALKP